MINDRLARLAASLLRIRQDRAHHFTREMFGGEQAWDMLLILFVADALGECITGREAVSRDGGSAESGRRWLRYLSRRQYVVGDGDGDLDDTLTLTPLCLNLLERWLEDAGEALSPLGA